MTDLRETIEEVERPQLLAAPEPESIGDEPPKRGGMSFPNASGGGWRKEEAKPLPERDEPEEKPKPKETPRQKRARIERNLGRGYMGLALFVKKAQGYPGDVLISQSEEFVDSVMALAEEKPRVMEWLDSATEIGVYGKLFAFGASISLPILAYYGFFPEELVNLLVAKEWLDVPPIPPEE